MSCSNPGRNTTHERRTAGRHHRHNRCGAARLYVNNDCDATPDCFISLHVEDVYQLRRMEIHLTQQETLELRDGLNRALEGDNASMTLAGMTLVVLGFLALCALLRPGRCRYHRPPTGRRPTMDRNLRPWQVHRSLFHRYRYFGRHRKAGQTQGESSGLAERKAEAP